MSELPPIIEWPAGYLAALLLLIVCLIMLFERARTASERLTVTVGAIGIGPPTLVALPATETSMAVGLLGGAFADYLAESEREQSR
jgi:hypothetical protein